MNNEARLSRWLTALGEQGQLEGPAATRSLSSHTQLSIATAFPHCRVA